MTAEPAGRILFISNGHGEDHIAAGVAAELKLGSGVASEAYPLVGLGQPYRNAGIPVTGRLREFPSGGFARTSWGGWRKDLREGLLAHTVRQFKDVRRLAPRYALAVTVGDIVPLAFAASAFGRNVAFLSTAKSEHIAGHFGVESWLMRRFCRLVLTRDEPTAESLRRRGVPAEWLGNWMMDAVAEPPGPLPVQFSQPCVALLPGSRKEAYGNLELILDAAYCIHERRPSATFLLALAGSLEPSEVARRAREAGWRAAGGGAHLRLLRHGACVHVLTGHFTGILHAASIAIGMAGTANEQAAGLGVPVVAAPGRGDQFTPGFLARQARLLGGAVVPVDPSGEAIAREVLDILEDAGRYRAMQEAGRERMGGPGGTRRTAERIAALLERKEG